jgi:hypothetical protein
MLMRKLLVIGTAVLSLALGASAALADNPNVPTWSPYALVPVGASSPVIYSMSQPTYEARAATIESPGAAVPNGNVPCWSPYALVPQGH